MSDDDLDVCATCGHGASIHMAGCWVEGCPCLGWKDPMSEDAKELCRDALYHQVHDSVPADMKDDWVPAPEKLEWLDYEILQDGGPAEAGL